MAWWTRRTALSLGMSALGAGVLAAAPATAAAMGRDKFAAARATFETAMRYNSQQRGPLPSAPQGVFDLVTYPSGVGPLGAYVTPDPKDGRRHPAIVWLTGGETNTVGDVWSPRPRDNDQSAAAYRQAGVAMMFPSLRGGNDNPGQLEALYGEVDDVIAAAEWLAQQPWIDPARIYLGGHSTGGSLALLVAETTDRFRAVFAFGAVSSVLRDYGPDFAAVDVARTPDPVGESLKRAPGYWLPSIKSKTFVIDGTVDSNVDTLREMRKADETDGRNSNLVFIEVRGADHFSLLAPCNEIIAAQILADAGPATTIALTQRQLERALREKR